MYTAILYHNTGFSGNNVPADVSVLASCAKKMEQKTLNIVQNYPLTYIDIHGKFNDYKDVDYIKIGDYVYEAFPAPMPSNDGARLSLTFRGLTGSGGAFKIVQGVTARTTRHGDVFGEYAMPDPLTKPAEPLQIEYKNILDDSTHRAVVVSTVDLSAVIDDGNGGYTFPGKTFTDPNDPNKYATVPYVPPNEGETTFKLDGVDLPSNPGTKLFSVDQFNKAKGILRSLGLESSVSEYLVPTNGTTFSSGAIDDAMYTGISSTRRVEPAFDPNYGEVTNKRVLYGEYNTWGLVTASGDKSEFNVEDILPSGYVGGSVNVIRKSDLRPDGRPYFRFEYYLGNRNDEYFFVKAVQGAPWQNTPIVWTGASNSWMASYQHANKMDEMTAEWQYGQKSREIDILRAKTNKNLGIIEGTREMLKVPDIGKGLDAETAVVSAIHAEYAYENAVVDFARASEYNKAMYGHNRTKELTEFGYSQAVVQPEISTPYNANLIREMTNNGVIVYRYKYSENDLTRIDKLLTMFGYAIVRPVTIEDIYEKGKTSGFTYLECQGISLTSDTLPKWYLDLMEAEIESGVRIWHSRPTGE